MGSLPGVGFATAEKMMKAFGNIEAVIVEIMPPLTMKKNRLFDVMRSDFCS